MANLDPFGKKTEKSDELILQGKSVCLSDHKFSSGNIDKYIKQLNSSKDIVELNLSQSNIAEDGDIFRTMIKCLRDHPSIELIDLSHTNIGTNECVILGELIKDNPRIKEINLGHNQINDEAALHLLNGMQQNKYVRTILLGFNKITDQMGGELLEVFRNTQHIQNIVLSNNPIESDMQDEFEKIAEER